MPEITQPADPNSRFTQMREKAEKTLQGMHDEEREREGAACEVCGGLPSGLAPQVYDDETECECE